MFWDYLLMSAFLYNLSVSLALTCCQSQCFLLRLAQLTICILYISMRCWITIQISLLLCLPSLLLLLYICLPFLHVPALYWIQYVYHILFFILQEEFDEVCQERQVVLKSMCPSHVNSIFSTVCGFSTKKISSLLRVCGTFTISACLCL